MHFNRKVADLRDPKTIADEDPNFLSNFPKQGPSYPKLVFPNKYHLHLFMPIVYNGAFPLSAENIDLPREDYVYFESKQ